MVKAEKVLIDKELDPPRLKDISAEAVPIKKLFYWLNIKYRNKIE